GLPHPVHIHSNNLGVAGNWETTLHTMQALEGRRAHLTHVQFHSYGGEPGALPSSRVADLAEYVNSHDNLSVDVGQVMFGDTTTMTGDGPLEYFLHGVTGRKWFNGDVELESGCGVVPIRYKNRSHVHTTMWAVGLEWFLLMRDPWRIALSTDHPNGGSFVSYPHIIRLLMDREFRREAIRGVNQKAVAKTHLPDLDREYSLSEIAIITRAAPARMLGLSRKGHLAPGADADIAVYNPAGDWEQTFAWPRTVIKGGEVIIEDGELRRDLHGRSLYVDPGYDPAILPEIRQWFSDFYTIEFANYPVGMEYLPHAELIKTGQG
ncbi:MAG TPA: formylmethanofuran dehydrogenase subunit A, partial [Candidatus Methylomirabilis sp.]|nr:formylmethanofuran dehydrogenase subunit A [Candidatus Methylomirabilis sp.]